jgi:Ca-activated chloride channel family protein
VIVLKVTPTMLAEDIQPSRLKRSVHKIRDLLALRKGMNTGLVAYAGSSHLVMPITADAEILEAFAAELDPDIMPKQGDDVGGAIALADQVLASAGRPGSILLITDGFDPQIADSAANSTVDQPRSPVHVLAVAGDQSKPLPLGSPPAPALDRDKMQAGARSIGATLTYVTTDQEDVEAISRNITTSFVAAEQDDGKTRWMDMGYWLTPGILLLSLLTFRPGWVVKWN